jgi:hypothetical protein
MHARVDLTSCPSWVREFSFVAYKKIKIQVLRFCHHLQMRVILGRPSKKSLNADPYPDPDPIFGILSFLDPGWKKSDIILNFLIKNYFFKLIHFLELLRIRIGMPLMPIRIRKNDADHEQC